MFEKLKEKGARLMLVPAIATAGAPAFAGDLTAAVTEAKTKIGESIPDAVMLLGAIMAIAVVIWVGVKLVSIISRKG